MQLQFSSKYVISDLVLGAVQVFLGEMCCSAQPVMGGWFGVNLVMSLCWLGSRMGIKMSVKFHFPVGNAESQGCAPLPFPHIPHSNL